MAQEVPRLGGNHTALAGRSHSTVEPDSCQHRIVAPRDVVDAIEDPFSTGLRGRLSEGSASNLMLGALLSPSAEQRSQREERQTPDDEAGDHNVPRGALSR